MKCNLQISATTQSNNRVEAALYFVGFYREGTEAKAECSQSFVEYVLGVPCRLYWYLSESKINA